jgi:hypothetical protein
VAAAGAGRANLTLTRKVLLRRIAQAIVVAVAEVVMAVEVAEDLLAVVEVMEAEAEDPLVAEEDKKHK